MTSSSGSRCGRSVSFGLTSCRRQLEELDRHEAIHAIGSVLMGALHQATQDNGEPDPTSIYYRDLMQLTAEKWLRQEL